MNLKLKNFHFVSKSNNRAPKSGRATIVLSVPDKADLLTLREQFFESDKHPKFEGLLGYSYTHPHDAYVKKIGAILANERVQKYDFHLVSVEKLNPTATQYKFIATEQGKTFQTDPAHIPFSLVTFCTSRVVKISMVELRNRKRCK